MIHRIFLYMANIPNYLVGMLLFLYLFSSLYCGHVSAGQESSVSVSNKRAYSFGVFPFLPASRLEGTFAPIAAEITQALGRNLHYRSASTFEKFMARLEHAEFDIAFIQPFDYVRIAVDAGYLPVVKRREQLFAVFVVEADGPFQDIRDLRGKTIAMAPKVAALSYLGRVALLEADINPEQDVTLDYKRGHHSCLHQVAVGKAGACVTGLPALRIFEAKVGLKLRVLRKTPPIPQMLFVVHSRISEHDREAIKKTLLATTLSGVEPTLKALLAKDDSKPFIPVTDADYDIVRRYWKALEKK